VATLGGNTRGATAHNLIAVRAFKCAATLSNCGKTLKPCVPTLRGNTARGRGNDLGYGKNRKDVTMGNPQPSAKGIHTAYACSSETKW